MFANVSNAADIHLSECFFRDFSSKQTPLQYIQTEEAHLIPPIGYREQRPENFQLNGLSVFLQFWFNQCLLSPDMCWRYTNPRIITILNSKESRVEFDFELSLTAIYEIQYHEVIPTPEEQQRLLSQPKSTNKKRKITPTQPPINTTNTPINYNNRLLNKLTKPHALATKPFEMKIGGLMSLFLDSSKLITKVQFQGLEKTWDGLVSARKYVI
jgi:hypothetical protein